MALMKLWGIEYPIIKLEGVTEKPDRSSRTRRRISWSRGKSNPSLQINVGGDALRSYAPNMDYTPTIRKSRITNRQPIW